MKDKVLKIFPYAVCKAHDACEASYTKIYHVWNGNIKLTSGNFYSARAAWDSLYLNKIKPPCQHTKNQ